MIDGGASIDFPRRDVEAEPLAVEDVVECLAAVGPHAGDLADLHGADTQARHAVVLIVAGHALQAILSPRCRSHGGDGEQCERATASGRTTDHGVAILFRV